MLIFPQPGSDGTYQETCDSKGSTCYSAGGGAGGTVLIQAGFHHWYGNNFSQWRH